MAPSDVILLALQADGHFEKKKNKNETVYFILTIISSLSVRTLRKKSNNKL